MKAQDFKKIIREIVDKVLAENQPAVKEPITKPATPPVKKPGPFSPDKDKNNIPEKIPAKAEKAMNEEEYIKKIVARFKSKKLDEGSSKVDLTAKNQDEISALSSEQKKKLYDELTDAATEVNDEDFKTKAEYAKAMKDAKIKVYKKYIKL